MANIKQTVDLTQGTFNNLVAESGKLKLKSVSAPVFTRNSTATKSDGSVVPVNTPRFESAQNFTYIEDTNAEFRTGTLSNVTALRDLVLSKDGNPDFIKYESTQSDFSTGTLNNVQAYANGLSLTGTEYNYALGKSYTKSHDPHPSYPDTNNSMFTDGVESGTLLTDMKGFGYQYTQLGVPNGGVGTLEITIDLGSNKTIYKCVFVSALAYVIPNEYCPDIIEILTSTDGSTFTSRGSVGTLGTVLSKTTIITFSPTVARYVKFKITKDLGVSTGGGEDYDWLFASEGYVYGYIYNSSGTRISPVLDISSVKKARSSIVTWSATTPSGTSIKVETNLSLDGGTTWSGWKEVTNGGSIPDIDESTDLSNAKIQYRQTLTTTNTDVTPQLNDFVIEILSDANYKTSGYRISPAISVPNYKIKNSKISWTANTPAGTNVSIEVSWDNGTTWETCTNGGVIPCSVAVNPAVASFKIRETLSTDNNTVTPKLEYLKIEVPDRFGQAIMLEQATANHSVETLYIPSVTDFLSLQQGTIETWFYVPSSWTTASSIWFRIWSVGEEKAAGMYVFTYDPTINKLIFRIYTTTSAYNGVSVGRPSVGWHHLVSRWSSSEMAIFVDGVKVGYYSNPTIPTNFAGSNLTIGCGATSPYDVSVSLIDEFRISSIPRSDQEIQAVYQSVQPMPIDEYTTYLLRFSGALNFGRGGYYISPQYDLSTVGSYVKHRVYWQEDADKEECLVYAKLDNQSDWTQLTNGGSLPIVEGQDLTGRKIQFKVKLLDLV